MSKSSNKNRGRNRITRLIKRDGPCCHYCNKMLNMITATADHVVPKCFGGTYEQDNIVLACSDCNGLRGNDMDWCDCDFCGPLITNYKASQRYYDYIFAGITRFHQKPRVKRVKAENGGWRVYYQGNTYSFDTWDEALYAALELYYPARMRIENA